MKHTLKPMIAISILLLASCTKESTMQQQNLLINSPSSKTSITKSHDIKSNLVAYYSFSGNANDVSGSGNNGIVYGATLTTDRTGAKNRAYSFNGISNYMDVTNKFFDNGWENMTVSLWFNATNDPIVGGGHTFLNTVPHNGLDIGVNFNGDNSIYVFKGSNPDNSGWDILSYNNFNTIPATDKWYHMTIVKAGYEYRYYLNGVHNKTVSTPYLPVSYNCSIKIGSYAMYGDYFKGKLDEIRIYNRALTNDQIAYLATQ